MPFASLQYFQTSGAQFLTFAAPYLAALSFVLALLCMVIVLGTRSRLKRLGLGRNGSIEESIAILSRESKEMITFRREIERYLKHAEARLRASVQGVATVRFNPFVGGQGGNQSFATAFLDEEGSGVVFSTLYARDRVGVYAKAIDKGVSSHELTAEEKEAVAKAAASIARHKK